MFVTWVMGSSMLALFTFLAAVWVHAQVEVRKSLWVYIGPTWQIFICLTNIQNHWKFSDDLTSFGWDIEVCYLGNTLVTDTHHHQTDGTNRYVAFFIPLAFSNRGVDYHYYCISCSPRRIFQFSNSDEEEISLRLSIGAQPILGLGLG